MAVLAVVWMGCGKPGPPNLVVVSVDTLRADAIGAYGGPIATPAFDRLAAEGVLFEQAIAPAPETAATHATLFTGQRVQRHGVVRNGTRFPAELVTLAETFRAAGYRTAAFVSSFVLDARFGWGQGFQLYDSAFPRSGETVRNRAGFWGQHEFDGFDRRAAATNQGAIAWLEDVEEPFLLFVHYFDPHAPNAAAAEAVQALPSGFARERAATWVELLDEDQRDVAQLRALIRGYHAEVMATDSALGDLLDALDARGLARNTLVAVTADHGEGLGEHGLLDHAAHLYEEQLHVPLIVRWPAALSGGRRVSATVGLVDLAPTLWELAGVDASVASADGRSLAAALRDGGEPSSGSVLSRRRTFARRFQGQLGTKFSVRTDRWKYIRSSAGPDELYDLTSDRSELHNVWEREAEAVKQLGALLDAHLEEHPLRESTPQLTEEERRALEAMGYGTH
jgi:arylsulfatase A-like enzyme